MGLCHSVFTSFYRTSFYLRVRDWISQGIKQCTKYERHRSWKIPKSDTASICHLFYFPMHHILCLLISFCKPVPLFHFSSFVSHFPILRSILLPSPSYYHYLHSFFLSCSVLPRWLTVQTRRGKLGCSHNDRPFVLICSSSSSIKVSTQASNAHKQTHSHLHTYSAWS